MKEDFIAATDHIPLPACYFYCQLKPMVFEFHVAKFIQEKKL